MTSLDGNGHPDTVWTAADGQADLVASIIIQKVTDPPTRAGLVEIGTVNFSPCI